MVGSARDDLSEPTIVTYRLDFEISVTERIDNEVTNEPRRHAEKVKVEKMVHDRQRY